MESRYQKILDRISSAAKGRQITLIAVSKLQSVESIEALYRFGHRDFGENYAQELFEKAKQLSERGCDEIRWHFIGHLQRNKVKMLLPVVHTIHSLDSEKLAHELSKCFKEQPQGEKKTLPVFLEINVDHEPSKSGLLPEETLELASKLAQIPELDLQGLMCIPAPGNTHPAYSHLRTLAEQCGNHTKGLLSMGMSDDFEQAIHEGATHIRVGTALFGQRSVPQKSG